MEADLAIERDQKELEKLTAEDQKLNQEQLEFDQELNVVNQELAEANEERENTNAELAITKQRLTPKLERRGIVSKKLEELLKVANPNNEQLAQIKDLQTEQQALNNEVAGMQENIDGFNTQLDSLNNQIEHLQIRQNHLQTRLGQVTAASANLNVGRKVEEVKALEKAATVVKTAEIDLADTVSTAPTLTAMPKK